MVWSVNESEQEDKMQEAQFSCNFRMYNPDGELEQFTVRGDTPEQFAANRAALQALLSGYSWEVPDKNTKPKKEPIVGYVVGETKDGTVCLHLYRRGLKFKAYTLYPEDKHLFPKPWPSKSEWPGVAPEQEDAVRRGYFHPLEFDLPVTPILDPEGNPVKSESGYIRYKPDRNYTGGASVNSANRTEHKQPSTPSASSTSTIQYIHRRALPNVGNYSSSQIGSESADEPTHNDWWRGLNAAEQDALMYGRTFVASYKKAPASEHAQKIWQSITQQIADMNGLDVRIVRVYAHYALTDHAHNPEEPPLTGIVQWLAECAMEKKADGKANPFYDPEWMSAFASILVKIYAADSDGGDDDDTPFSFSDDDGEDDSLGFTL